jgi:hypothetical protein
MYWPVLYDERLIAANTHIAASRIKMAPKMLSLASVLVL